MSYFRAATWTLGVSLLAFAAIGAKRLLNVENQAPGADGAVKSAPVPAGSTVLLGTVDSEPPPVRIGAPSIGVPTSVKTVVVKEGDEVKPDMVLVCFDDSIFRTKQRQAQAGLEAAMQEAAKAEVQRKAHEIQLARQKNAAKSAEEMLHFAEASLQIARERFDRAFPKTNPLDGSAYTEEYRSRERNQDADLRRLEATLIDLRLKAEDEKRKVEALELTPVGLDIKLSEAKIALLKAQEAEAQALIDACTLRAQVAGTVEQIYASPGMTYGPATREPVLILVPSGPRIVRAEVEAEFAWKVSDKVGAKVTVYDHNNLALKYDGIVRRLGTAYLQKRNAFDVISPNASKVLECRIEILDSAPAGKPPLRVGQPVRIGF